MFVTLCNKPPGLLRNPTVNFQAAAAMRSCPLLCKHTFHSEFLKLQAVPGRRISGQFLAYVQLLQSSICKFLQINVQISATYYV